MARHSFDYASLQGNELGRFAGTCRRQPHFRLLCTGKEAPGCLSSGRVRLLGQLGSRPSKPQLASCGMLAHFAVSLRQSQPCGQALLRWHWLVQTPTDVIRQHIRSSYGGWWRQRLGFAVEKTAPAEPANPPPRVADPAAAVRMAMYMEQPRRAGRGFHQ